MLFLPFICLLLESVSCKDGSADFNPQPDPPIAPPDDPGLVGPKTCCDVDCPPPAHCEMIIPPGGTIPKPTCVCPEGQVWSECSGCTLRCIDLIIARPCPRCCPPPQCVCPDGQLFDDYGDCIPKEECPPRRG